MENNEMFFTKDRFQQGWVINKKTVPNNRALLVIEMLTKMGLTTGVLDGEDSQGRAKLNVMSVKETVQRAVDIADEAFNQFEKRGWLISLPKLETEG